MLSIIMALLYRWFATFGWLILTDVTYVVQWRLFIPNLFKVKSIPSNPETTARCYMIYVTQHWNMVKSHCISITNNVFFLALTSLFLPTTQGHLFAYAVFTKLACLNTLRQRQNGRHFPDDAFKHIILDENVGSLIKLSQNFVPTGLINKFCLFVCLFRY